MCQNVQECITEKDLISFFLENEGIEKHNKILKEYSL